MFTTSALVLVLAALRVTGSPLAARQALDFDAIDEIQDVSYDAVPAVLSDSVSYNPSAAASSVAAAIATDPVQTEGDDAILPNTSVLSLAPVPTPSLIPAVAKRGVNDACALQPNGTGPAVRPDTPSNFTAYGPFQNFSSQARVPAGYVKSFEGKNASVQGLVYLGLTTIASYNTSLCAALCDNKAGCQGFNIFFERNPVVNPAPACPGAASLTNVKCTLWGYPVDGSLATNTGETRYDFVVVIAGSNGYNRIADPNPVPGFTGPVRLAGAINAPLLNGNDTYMGYKTFSDVAYSPDTCAALCDAQTAYNSRHPRKDGTYQTCRFFNVYILNKNNQPTGTFCSLYSAAWNATYAVNYGQTRGQDRYDVVRSYSFAK